MNYLIDENKQKPQNKGGVGWFFSIELFLMALGFFAGFMWQYDPLITLLPILMLSFLTLIVWENSK